jgi:hypothetical protein
VARLQVRAVRHRLEGHRVAAGRESYSNECANRRNTVVCHLRNLPPFCDVAFGRCRIERLEIPHGTVIWSMAVGSNCCSKTRRPYRARRSAYATKGTTGRATAEKLITTFPTCPIPEVPRLGRTLHQWRSQVLAYFATSGVSNGGTEAINLLIEKTRRLAHSFRNFDNHRLRILARRPRVTPLPATPNHAQ